MRVLVTGATGFIGSYVVPKLLQQRCEVVAVSRSKENLKKQPWYRQVKCISCDIYEFPEKIIKECGEINVLCHLAWQGLPNYNAPFHIEKNLFSDYLFIKAMVNSGVRNVMITGTCFEYGKENGCLLESMSTNPHTSYGVAKDTLRKFLQILQNDISFKLQWIRLFYVYGERQRSNSLLGQLDKAIDNNESQFNMTNGDQLRDYLPVEDAAGFIVQLIQNGKNGVFNCCSGKPISVRELVENRIKERKVKMNLNLGFYPYSDYEPMAFWGDSRKMNYVLKKMDKETV